MPWMAVEKKYEFDEPAACTSAADMSRGQVFPKNTGEDANGENDERRHEK